MAKNSNIEWTTHTFNPWRGCTKVSDGCKNCYAETLSKRNPKVLGEWGPNGTRVVASESYWKQPLKWGKDAAAYPDQCTVCGTRLCMSAQEQMGNTVCPSQKTDDVFDPSVQPCGGEVLRGVRPRVFCASLADVFEDRPELHTPRLRLFQLIRNTPNLDWLLLTKRPENIKPSILTALILSQGGDPNEKNYFVKHGEDFPKNDLSHWLNDWIGVAPPSNVWLGTSVENQEQANKRIPELLKVPAAIRFLSCEPLLGRVELSNVSGWETRDAVKWLGKPLLTPPGGDGIHWVIVGGESGPGARPMHPDWARSLRDQCEATGAKFFFKQWGEFEYRIWPYTPNREPYEHFIRVGKKAAGRVLDGRTWDEIPTPTIQEV